LLAHPETHHPFIDSDLFERIGGALTISALIASLYDGIESDPMLRPLFGRDLALERESQQRFSTGWFGGEREYTNRAYLALEHRHDLLPITRARGKMICAFQSCARSYGVRPARHDLDSAPCSGAVDDKGRTPQDRLENAAKSGDREALRRALRGPRRRKRSPC